MNFPDLPPVLLEPGAPAIRTEAPCRRALARLLAEPDEPLLYANWDRVLMIHFAIAPEDLNPHVPFPLDVRDGSAFVSLVAFTMRDMRPRRGGRLGRLLFRPIATHGFLNVRTYVRVGREPGIHFLREYMDNRLSRFLGPLAFALPYRHARIDYSHEWHEGELRGLVRCDRRSSLAYRVALSAAPLFAASTADSLIEWLMERYSAFNAATGRRRLFRVWHAPWRHTPVEAELLDTSLLRAEFPWFAGARLVGANFSPGLRDVWMGRPHPVGAD